MIELTQQELHLIKHCLEVAGRQFVEDASVLRRVEPNAIFGNTDRLADHFDRLAANAAMLRDKIENAE